MADSKDDGKASAQKKSPEERKAEFEKLRSERIESLQKSLKNVERLTCDENQSLVNVLDSDVDCSKFKQQFRDCLVKNDMDREQCKHEMLLYAMCNMKKEASVK